jgi:hypothetical protein
MSRPDRRQVAAIAAQLHQAVDVLVGAYWEAERIREEYAAGRSGIGRSSGGAWSDPTSAAAIDEREGPGRDAARIMVQIEAWRDTGLLAVGRWEELARATRTLTPAEAAAIGGRTNTAEVCFACHKPNPRMHRVDGRPYCASSCYYVQYRAGRK